ncbi:MAG: hypothetical protein ACT6S0_24175 [Roseateles sp.]|uniref:hypothetical protein n=1 Tax=Roseateles sp. TaxID=1971397 RepID=UPI0040375E9C
MRFVKLLDWLGLLVALAISFGAGALTAGLRGSLQPQMTVHVINQAGQPVSQVTITTKNSARTVTTQLGPLPLSAKTTARLAIAGEGLYQVEATLADGRVIAGGPAYVHSGYSTEERLQADKVHSQVTSLW